MAKKVQFNVRLPVREVAMLRQSAKAYRAPNVGWFVEEMIKAMLNPAIQQEFQQRLLSGAQQLALELHADKPGVKRRARPKKRRPA